MATQLDPGSSDAPADLARARGLIGRSRRIVVLAGAGISTESGIPDFRGPSGLWTKDPGAERRATLDAYLSDPEVRRTGWRNRLASRGRSPEPNAGHRALVQLERAGRLDTLVTQNIDGLHHQAGNDPARVVEIHGNVREVACLICGHRQPMTDVLARVELGDDDPRCLVDRCGGILKSATVSFGQSLDPDDLGRAEDAARRCDLLLAVGTTLAVYPAAGLVPLADRAGAPVIIVNGEPTPYDQLAAVVLRGSIGIVLPTIVDVPATPAPT